MMAEYNRVIAERRRQRLMVAILIACWLAAGLEW